MDLINAIVELYKKVATELPKDVIDSLKEASLIEEGLAKDILKKILENIGLAKELKKPIEKIIYTHSSELSVRIHINRLRR